MRNDKKSESLESIGSFLSGALVAVALAGYFFFGSKNAKKNKQKVEGWVTKARAEVLEKVKRVKKISRDKYEEIVDAISDKYAKIKEVGQEKADDLKQELKDRWTEVEKEVLDKEK